MSLRTRSTATCSGATAAAQSITGWEAKQAVALRYALGPPGASPQGVSGVH